MTIKVGCSMLLQGCKIEAEIEVSDDVTPEGIEAEVREWALGQFDWWHERTSADLKP